MDRAHTIFDAGYGAKLRVDRDLWDPALKDEAFNALYVPRRRADDPDPKRSGTPISRQIANLLRGDHHAKVLLTGQKGSGKSTELRRTLADESVRAGFYPVTLVVSERIDLLQPIDMRYFLLVLATALAEHASRAPIDGPEGWAARAGDRLGDWVSLLKDFEAPVAPGASSDAEAQWKAGLAGITDLTVKLRSSEQLRAETLRKERFGLARLSVLTHELLGLLRALVGRDLLVVIDDGDKLFQESAVREVFLTNVVELLRLPAAVVATFPYWLDFEPEFNAVRRLCHSITLSNVKVVRREAPGVVVPGAYEFFRQMYTRLVEPGTDWVTADALDRAVLLSAGIPREFLRVLERAFRLAHDWDEARVTVETITYAARDLSREMIPSTQTDATRRRLERVRLGRQLATVEDRKLLDGLLVVELTNDLPWYDVHPLLQEYVDALLRDRALLLRIPGDAPRDERDRLLREALEK